MFKCRPATLGHNQQRNDLADFPRYPRAGVCKSIGTGLTQLVGAGGEILDVNGAPTRNTHGPKTVTA